MLEIARHFRKLTQGQLSLQTNTISQSKISKIKNEQLTFDIQDGEIFASALNLPLDFFFKRFDPYENLDSVIQCTTKSMTRYKLIADLKILFNGINSLMEFSKIQSELKVLRLTGKSPSQAAKEVRAALSIPATEINILDFLLNSNIIIHQYKSSDDKFEGMGWATSSKIDVVILNMNMDNLKKKEVLVREIGRLALNERHSDSGSLNMFTQEFLLPVELVNSDLKNLTFHKLQYLSDKWQLSSNFIIARASELNLIKDNTYRYLQLEVGRRKKSNRLTSHQALKVNNFNRKLYDVRLGKNYINEDLASETGLYIKDFKDLFLI